MTTEKPVVLMLDDQDDQLEMVRGFFEGIFGYTFIACKTVEEAITKLHDTPGKIVAFVDIHIKGSTRNGFDLLTYIRVHLSNRVVAYAYTGEHSLPVEQKALAAGAINVFHKLKDPVERLVAYAESELIGNILHNAVVDDLTPVLRFKFFQNRVVAMLKAARERGLGDEKQPRVFSLLLIDPRGIGRINHEYGPVVGDQVIAAIGSVVFNSLQPTDPACRKSGDKFLAWLPNVDKSVALERGERIAHAVSETLVPLADGTSLSVGVAYGVATVRQEDIWENESAQLDNLIKEAYDELE